MFELEFTGETEALRKNREVRNQEERVDWENHVIKAREKGVLCNSFRWDEADAKVRSYIFLCLGADGKDNCNRNGLIWSYNRFYPRNLDNPRRYFYHNTNHRF